jgi:membrane-bound lytic murein transglycosylase D
MQQHSGFVFNALANHRVAVDLASLKQYVKSGEQALELKDWSGALAWSEQSRALLDSLPDDVRKLLDVVAIQVRLENLRARIKASDSISLRLDAGLDGTAEVSSVTSERARVELEQTKNAVVGAIFDFPIDLNDKVLAWVHQFTTKKRNFMEQTLSRASQYLPMVHQIFAEEHVPQDLAYLAVIESGFINSASSCANAVGMWQFMRSTGHIYGLSGNSWVEERRDPVKSTRAAAKYLRQLYTISGDWYLALAGYNAGPSTTQRAIHNLGTRNFWDMHRSRWLRNQTKNYVPELCAAILIGRFPEMYGLKVEKLAPYTYETIEVDRMTSLPVLARYSDTDVNKLKALNPELLRDITPPGKYMLRVPPGMGGIATRALASIPDDKRLDFVPYSISQKDKIDLVAAKFNLSVDDLLHINNITKDQFRSGLVIQVPPPTVGSISNVRCVSKNEHTNYHCRHLQVKPSAITMMPSRVGVGVGSVSIPKKPIRADVKLSDAATLSTVSDKCKLHLSSRLQIKQKSKPIVYVVRRGDSLFAIASRYGVDLKILRKLNNIKSSEIHVDQRLYLN